MEAKEKGEGREFEVGGVSGDWRGRDMCAYGAVTKVDETAMESGHDSGGASLELRRVQCNRVDRIAR